MTMHDVERRLVAVLHQHAEDAMTQTDTQAQHEILTIGRQDDPGPGPRRLVATAVAAAGIAAAGVVVLWSAGSGRDSSSPDPAVDPTTTRAVAVAEAFVHAIAAKNPHVASLYVAPGHEPWAGWEASVRRDIAWQVDYDLQPCTVADGDGPGTRLDCPYSMDLLGSAAVGAGPFDGNVLKVQVVDGKVVWVENSDTTATDLSALSAYLNDLRTWVGQHHPDDLAFLLTDEQELTDRQWTRWTDLWRQYAAEYVATQG
jgi:hypothetical protein